MSGLSDQYMVTADNLLETTVKMVNALTTDAHVLYLTVEQAHGISALSQMALAHIAAANYYKNL